MSVASRILKRENHSLLKPILQRQVCTGVLPTPKLLSSARKGTRFSYDESSKHQTSCRRRLATPAKSPPQPTDGQKSETKSETAQVQSSPAGQKAQSPQAGLKAAPPGQKVQASPSTASAQKVQASPGPASAQKVQPSPVGQKVPITASGQKLQAAAVLNSQKGQTAQAALGQKSPIGQHASSQASSKKKLLLASGVVAGLSMAILYWQYPSGFESTFHEGVTKIFGRKDEDGGINSLPAVDQSSESDTPAAEDDKFATEEEKFAAEADKPVAEADKPVAEADKPVAEADKPVAEADKPVDEDKGYSIEGKAFDSISNQGPGDTAMEPRREINNGEKSLVGSTVSGPTEHSQTQELQSPIPGPAEHRKTQELEGSPNESIGDRSMKTEVQSSPEEQDVSPDTGGYKLDKEGAAETNVPETDLVMGVKEPTEFESFLLQRGHEANVKRHEESDLVSLNREETRDVVTENASPRVTEVDVVAVIHAAEQRQAENDAAVFKEQLQIVQEKHQREVLEAELKAAMYQEQIHRLEKDMDKVKLKHAQDLRVQQEEAEVKLQNELNSRDEAAQRQLEEAALLSKAEALTALIEERAALLKDIGSVKLHVEAMNVALDAKSEEAREGHTVKELSLGTFALEDALQRGAPVVKEAALLLESAGGDPLVEVAVTSLTKEVLEEGTLTPAQLDLKLEQSKHILRELALIPAGGGGLLSRLLARLASTLKVSEHGSNETDGVDSVISVVEARVKEGNLVEAADLLEKCLAGTNAESLAAEWASEARNRAIVEQACALLRAHAAAIALSYS